MWEIKAENGLEGKVKPKEDTPQTKAFSIREKNTKD